MKLILGYIVRNEEQILKKTLPLITPWVDHVLAVDANSEDATVEVLREAGVEVVSREWNGSFSDARNACITLAEEKFPGETMLMLDADEVMFPSSFMCLRAEAPRFPRSAFAFPRYEFVDDYDHFDPSFYPDWQIRCFPLNMGYHFEKPLHESLCLEHGAVFGSPDCITMPCIHIFHYGKAQSPEHVWVKYRNYELAAEGLPRISAPPEGTVFPTTYARSHKLEFFGPKPL